MAPKKKTKPKAKSKPVKRATKKGAPKRKAPARVRPDLTPPERPSAMEDAGTWHTIAEIDILPENPSDCAKCGASTEEREDAACSLEGCPFDLPAGWTKHFRDDKGLFENICPHGIGHTAPESIKAEGDGIHGCDGCCATLAKPPPPPPEALT